MSVIVHSGLLGVSIHTRPVLPGMIAELDGVEIRHVDERNLVPVTVKAAKPLPQAPVHDLRRNDMGWLERQEDRRRRRHARTEHERFIRVLKFSDQAFYLMDGNIIRSAVDEARAIAELSASRMYVVETWIDGESARVFGSAAAPRGCRNSSARKREEWPVIHPVGLGCLGSQPMDFAATVPIRYSVTRL